MKYIPNSSSGDTLFAHNIQKTRKHCSESYNKDSNVRFLKLAFLLDAEFRLSNFPARQMVTVN